MITRADMQEAGSGSVMCNGNRRLQYKKLDTIHWQRIEGGKTYTPSDWRESALANYQWVNLVEGPSPSDELEAFKKALYHKVILMKSEHRWCGVADRFIRELGVAPDQRIQAARNRDPGPPLQVGEVVLLPTMEGRCNALPPGSVMQGNGDHLFYFRTNEGWCNPWNHTPAMGGAYTVVYVAEAAEMEVA